MRRFLSSIISRRRVVAGLLAAVFLILSDSPAISLDILPHYVSEDGQRMLLYLPQGEQLVWLDLRAQQAHLIDQPNIYDYCVSFAHEGIVYWKSGANALGVSKIFLSDFRGERKKELFRSRLIVGPNYPKVMWSRDGALLGMTRSSVKEAGASLGKSFVALYDSSGELLGKQVFPALENAQVYPVGWDHESRFYFRKEVAKGDRKLRSYWRIWRDHMTPEPVSLPTEENVSVELSPDGDWFVCEKETAKYIYSTTLLSVNDETMLAVSENASPLRWSADGKTALFLKKPLRKETESHESDVRAELVVYELTHRKHKAYLLERVPQPLLLPFPWCPPSDNCWFLADGNLYGFSLSTRQIMKVAKPGEKWTLIWWAPSGPSLWLLEDRLVLTDADGSNHREVFRVEGKKFRVIREMHD